MDGHTQYNNEFIGLGDKIYRDAPYFPDNLQSIYDQVNGQSWGENLETLNQILYNDELSAHQYNIMVLYVYAVYMDELDLDEVEYNEELTIRLLNRLSLIWYLYIQERRGFLNIHKQPPIYNESMEGVELTAYGLAYELFRTGTPLELPSLADIVPIR